MKLEPYSYYFFLTICAYEYFIFTRTFLPVHFYPYQLPWVRYQSYQLVHAKK